MGQIHRPGGTRLLAVVGVVLLLLAAVPLDPGAPRERTGMAPSPGEAAPVRQAVLGLPVAPAVPRSSGGANPLPLTTPASSFALLAAVYLGNGTTPVHPAYDPLHGYVQVSDFGTNQLSVISDQNNSLVATVPTGDDPFSAVYDPANGYTYVMNLGFSDNVSVFNGSTTVTSVPVGANPHFGVYDPKLDLVYEGNTGTNNVSVINGTTVVGNLDTGPSPFDLEYDPGHGYVYVTNFGGTTVTVLNGTAIVKNITAGAAPYWATYDSANGYVYVTDSGTTNVTVLDGTSVVATVPVGAAPYASTFDVQDGFVYVPNDLSNNVSVLNGTTVVATIPVGSYPVYATYDSADDLVFVVNYGSSNVSVISGTSVVATVDVGTLPKAAVYDSGNGNVYVANYGSDNVSVIGPEASPYRITFTETGLPVGTSWGLRVGAVTYTSTGSAVSVPKPNGTYEYVVSPVVGYATAPVTANVTVSGSSPAVTIAFQRAYAVSFTENGLPPGTNWSVLLGSSRQAGTTPTIVFEEMNGSYAYAVGPIPGYSTTWNGSVQVVGGPRALAVNFSQVTYGIQFVESGLPPGTNWSVTVRSAGHSSTSPAIIVPEPNGTYAYLIGAVAGYTTVWSGNVTVTGSAPTVPVPFTQVRYPVTFTESGLPTGTNWSVTIGPTTSSSTVASLSLLEPNGTFLYAVGPVPGYTTRWTGSVEVNASETNVTLDFFLTTFTVEFQERGLPPGANWSMTFAGTTLSTTGSTLAFQSPNGSYVYRIVAPAGFVVNGTGSVTIAGANVSVPIDMERTYALTFVSTGLPPGTSWSVRVGNLTVASGATTHIFPEPNGTYAYSVGPLPGFRTAWTGSVEVAGKPANVSVVFSLVTYPVTFAETGLPAGTNWTVLVGNATVSSTTGALTVALPNGTYDYAAMPVAGFGTPDPGTLWVNGTVPPVIPLAFSPAGATFLGLPALEGYLLLGALLAVVVGGIALGVLRRRRSAAAREPPGLPDGGEPEGEPGEELPPVEGLPPSPEDDAGRLDR